MNVKIKKSENYDGNTCEEMFINGKSVCYVSPLCECPEDAIIGRSLISCCEIFKYMKLAYEAGKNGEELELLEIIDTDEEK